MTGEAFFSLGRLLRFSGHPVPRRRCQRVGAAAYSHVMGFRRLPPGAPEVWGRLLQGVSREVVEWLALDLLEHAGARAKRVEIQDDLRAIGRFFETEARVLARARTVTGYSRYPVPQQDRNPLFVRYRRASA